MTGRERLDAILHRRNADCLSWTTLADAATGDHLPGSLRGGGGLELYRHLRCDTLLLNGWGTPHGFGNPALVLPEGVRQELWTEGDVDLCENTSTYFIGPEIYRRYNAPHVRDFVDAMRRGGKIALVHMCGHVRNLLDQFGGTGPDGIHALTPPPTGDTPWELALDARGEEMVIIGILDPSIFLSGPVEEIGPALDALYTPRMRRAHFALWAAADGIRVPLERFEAVAAWMDRNARR